MCLSRHHASPVDVTLSDNGKEFLAELAWESPGQRTLDAWANTTDATEAGAYGCVIAGVELLRGQYAVRRAETGTGRTITSGQSAQAASILKTVFALKCQE